MIWQINKNNQTKSLKTQVAPGVFLLFIFLFLSAISFPVLSQCTGSCTTTTISGGDVVVRFTGAGTFTPPEGIASVQYLVVGGGGGGGGTIGGANIGGAGGGGAGGVRSGTLTVTPLQSYTITVGAGGTGGVGNASAGGTGGASIFSTITANGGGGGASVGFAATTGGSGGGGRLDDNGAAGTAGQGNSGGTGAGTTTSSGAAAGGGGAGAAGSNGSANSGGAGGVGVSNSITGSAVTYGGGGGGGGFFNSSPGGAGGAGGSGGGGAAPGSRAAGNAGTANTGGGGGGAGGGANASGAFNGGAGGSGVVIIRYTPGGTRYAVANGNWNATSTWSSTSCSGSSGASVPTAADDVVICNSRTVTLTATAAAKSVVLELGNQDVNLNHNAGISLTVGSGGVTLNGDTNGSPTKSWNIGAGSAVVNGPVNLNGGDTNNRIVNILLSSGSLDINGNLTFTSSNVVRAYIQATGAANIYLSGSLSVSGSARMLPGTASTFTYDGTGTQTALLGVSEFNYYNLVLAGSGTKNQTTWSTPTIAGTTTVNNGVTFNNSASVNYQGEFVNNGTTNASAANVYLGNFTNNNTYTASAAQQYRANFSNSGTFNSGTGLHTFNGTSAQQITGATTFAWLALDNTNGLTLNNDVTVQTQLNLVNGALTTGSNILRVAQTGWSGVNRTNGWVAGNMGLWFPTGWQSRTFDIGDASAHRALALTIPNVTTAGYIIAAISHASGDHPQIASSSLDSALSVNRWWSITSGGAAMVSMDVVFNYLAADIDSGATPQNFIIQRYTGSNWDDVTEGTLNATNSQGTGITGFGEFAIAESGATNSICDTLVSGIYGQYFNNTTLSGTATATRLDGPVDFNWGTGAPGPTGIGANAFSVRWEGVLRVTQTGNYRFQTVSDDGVRLWVNEVQLINNWTDHSSAINTSAQIALTAGQTYTIRLEFYENGGSAEIRLRWQVPSSGSYVAIPAGPSTPGAGLYHCADTEVCADVDPAGGLLGEYFNNLTLTGTATGTRVDGPVDFQWNQAAPGVAGINADEFSVRWTGRLRATTSGSYQFQTRSDDGVRLWVNGQLLIDQWNDHSATDHTSGSISLVSGQVYTIQLEFYERFIDAEIRLRWLVPGSGSFVAIPAGVAPAATTAGLYHCPTAPTVVSYEIVNSPIGITCEAELITINAVGSGGGLVVPPANTTVTLSTSPATGVWVGGNTFIFSGTESSFTKYLQQLTTVNNMVINATDGVASGSGTIDFANVALRFYRDSSLSDPLLDHQVAGIANSNPVLRAVRTNPDSMACEARVSGTKTVQFAYECINPSTCSAMQSFTVNGTSINANNNGTVTSYANVSLTFDAAGVASIPLSFTDVGLVGLHANLSLPASGNDPAVTFSGSSSQFVVKPYTLAVSAVTGNPGTTNAGAGFIASGDDFSVFVEARNANGDRTPNFGNEATTERNNVELEIAQLIYPVGGIDGSLSGAAAGTFSAATPAGTMVNNTVSWNEVGSIQLRPSLSDNDYLGAGDLATLTTSSTIGRFYPHHFTLASSSVSNACPSVSGSAEFTYMGNAAIPVEYVLEARNADNDRTHNYTSPIYSGTASLNYVAENADAGVDLGSRVSLVSPSWSLGRITLPPPTLAAFARQSSTAPDGPYASLQLGVSLSGDIDSRTLENLDMNAETTGVCTPASCTAKAIGSPLNVRYGRLRLDDAFGPESVNLPVNFSTEYWVGSFFAKNTDDSCTAILRSAITYPSGNILTSGNLTVALSGGSTTGSYGDISATQVEFNNGDAAHMFLAPGTGTGLFNVSVDLTSFPWLRSDGNLNGDFNDDISITARYGFGQYRGHDRIIYWREKFE